MKREELRARLVLLHGWGFDATVWGNFAAELAACHEVRALDLPGHGAARAGRLGPIDALADTLAPSIPDGSVVCGWSLGALAALRLATRHPAKVAALALLSATPCFAQRADWPCGMARETLEAFALGVRADPRRALEEFVRLNALGSADAKSQIRALNARIRAGPLPSREALEGGLEILRTSDLRGDARRIRVPTVLVHGRGDRIAPIAAARWLAATIPNARLVERDSGHLAFMDAPAEVARVIGEVHA